MKLWRRIDRYALPRYSGSSSRVDEDVTGKSKYRKPFKLTMLFQNHKKILIVVTSCILLLFFMKDGGGDGRSQHIATTTGNDSRIDLTTDDGGTTNEILKNSDQEDTTTEKSPELNIKGDTKKIQEQRDDPSDVDNKPMEEEEDHKIVNNHDSVIEQQKGVADVSRREAVKSEFLHAWNAYKKHAWGKDDLHPIAKSGTDGYHMGLTMIDSLSTILVMGLDDEAKLCQDWIESSLIFGLKQQRDISVFESTIRVMGGLLSAYAQTNEPIYKTKATELADYLIVAFDNRLDFSIFYVLTVN